MRYIKNYIDFIKENMKTFWDFYEFSWVEYAKKISINSQKLNNIICDYLIDKYDVEEKYQKDTKTKIYYIENTYTDALGDIYNMFEQLTLIEHKFGGEYVENIIDISNNYSELLKNINDNEIKQSEKNHDYTKYSIEQKNDDGGVNWLHYVWLYDNVKCGVFDLRIDGDNTTVLGYSKSKNDLNVDIDGFHFIKMCVDDILEKYNFISRKSGRNPKSTYVWSKLRKIYDVKTKNINDTMCDIIYKK